MTFYISFNKLLFILSPPLKSGVISARQHSRNYFSLQSLSKIHKCSNSITRMNRFTHTIELHIKIGKPYKMWNSTRLLYHYLFVTKFYTKPFHTCDTPFLRDHITWINELHLGVFIAGFHRFAKPDRTGQTQLTVRSYMHACKPDYALTAG